ncbi:hypothetical protein ACP275_04G196200 [Erythranthe tilingii]
MEKENESNSSAIQLKGVPIHGGEFTQYNFLGNLLEVHPSYRSRRPRRVWSRLLCYEC